MIVQSELQTDLTDHLEVIRPLHIPALRGQRLHPLVQLSLEVGSGIFLERASPHLNLREFRVHHDRLVYLLMPQRPHTEFLSLLQILLLEIQVGEFLICDLYVMIVPLLGIDPVLDEAGQMFDPSLPLLLRIPLPSEEAAQKISHRL